MSTAYLKYSILIVCVALFASCGGGGDDTPPIEPQKIIPTPAATTLVFPDNNTECNTGEIVSDTQSSVAFKWATSQNTDSYELNIKNLNTNTSIKRTATTNELLVTIDRGTPYDWFVISRATGTNEVGTSPTWKFYNEGAGIENYAPFPATALIPERGANITTTSNSLTLTWEASDVDDDIVSYEVFMDTSETPTTSIGTATETTIDATIAAGNTYRWLVVTKDEGGNSSTSEIFEFRIN